jgi:hypothetical protein
MRLLLKTIVRMAGVIVFIPVFFCSQSVAGQKVVTAVNTKTAPVIDGVVDEGIWDAAKEVVIRDDIAGIDIRLRALYSGTYIFFLASFPDQDESRLHKPWVWNEASDMYNIGMEREDGFVFKWSISGNDAELSLRAARPHMADIWFWKANRTDPGGFADDKIQILGSERCRKCQKIISAEGVEYYLQRIGDKGRAAYKISVPIENIGEIVSQFEFQQPSKSRADVRAKGKWRDGMWTVEFSRALDTGNDDDISFKLANEYLFGISRYEIAGRYPDPDLSQPLYGAGDVGEPLVLRFMEGK